MTTKHSLVSHAITFQSSNAAADDLIYPCPIALGYENKDTVTTETACIKELSKLLCLENAIKVCSKKHGKSCFSVDQIEKISYTLFAADNSN